LIESKNQIRLDGSIYDLMNYGHSLFWRTRRDISAGGFFTTIHNITDVAAARAYLHRVNKTGIGFGGTGIKAYHVKIYCE